jgi:predicted kinase
LLVVFGGLPGTGKTTLARIVAGELEATYLRIDAIESALWRAGIERAEPTGLAAYVVAYAVAEGCLETGAAVVVDAVNPVEAARAGWRRLASRVGAPLSVVEVVCSDLAEHRRRVENRDSDLDELVIPTWADVEARDYEPWTEPRLVVDTSATSTADCVAAVLASVRSEAG